MTSPVDPKTRPVSLQYVRTWSPPSGAIVLRKDIDADADTVTATPSSGVITFGVANVTRWELDAALGYNAYLAVPCVDPADNVLIAYGISVNGDSAAHDASRLSRNEGTRDAQTYVTTAVDNIAPFWPMRSEPLRRKIVAGEVITSLAIGFLDNNGTLGTGNALELWVWRDEG